jgi:hypothetical protein
VESRADRREHAIDLAAVPSGEDDDVAGTLAQHALEEIGARVDLGLPRRRRVGACIERRHALQVLEQIEPERRIHIHAGRHARIHFFLNERGVEMPRIERHQTHVRHRVRWLLTARCRAADGRGGEQDDETGFRGVHAANNVHYTRSAKIG